MVWGDQYDEEWYKGRPYPPPLNSVTLFWDGDANAAKQLTDNDVDDKYPKVHNGQVVWEGFDGKDLECQEGLTCKQDVGGIYGMPWWYDFCEAPDID